MNGGQEETLTQGDLDAMPQAATRASSRWMHGLPIELKILLSIVFSVAWYFYVTSPQGSELISRKPAVMFIVLLIAAPCVFTLISTILRLVFAKIGARAILPVEIILNAITAITLYYAYSAIWVRLVRPGDSAVAFNLFFSWMNGALNFDLPVIANMVSFGANIAKVNFGEPLEWMLIGYFGVSVLETILGGLRSRPHN